MDVTEDYDAAREAAGVLPTWVLRTWERRASARASHGNPGRRELARLLGVRAVLAERGAR